MNDEPGETDAMAEGDDGGPGGVGGEAPPTSPKFHADLQSPHAAVNAEEEQARIGRS